MSSIAYSPIPNSPVHTTDLLAPVDDEMIEFDDIVEDWPPPTSFNPPPNPPPGLPPVFTKGYIANGVVTIGVSALQAFGNRLTDNNVLNVPAGKDNWITMSNTALTHFSNKMVKGNYLNVQNTRQQTAVLLGYIGQATLSDCIAYTLPVLSHQTMPIGQATVLSSVNALGYFSAIAAAEILGKGTHTLSHAQPTRSHMGARRAASCGLLALIAMGASTVNRTLLIPGSALSTIISHANSETVNKVLKAGQATEEQTSRKVLLLALYGVTAVAADVFMGLIIPSSISYTSPSRYISAVSTGACIEFLKVGAKSLLDHDRMPNAIVDEAEAKKRARSRKIKGIAAGALSLAMPILAIAANHSTLAATSPAASLVIKQVQHSLTGLAAQEVFKAVDGVFKRTLAIGAPIAVAIAGECIANWADPSKAGFSALNVALGTAASYMGMIASSWLIGRDDEDN